MVRVFRWWLVAACVASCFSPARARAEGDSVEAREQALAAYRRGNQAYSKGQLREALDEYRVAWKLGQSYDIACNLGRTETDLELWRDAAEHLSYCLTNFSVSRRPEVRKAEGRFRKMFADVKRRVGQLRLEVEPSAAEVFIDHKPIGRAPFDSPLFLDPGKHQLTVQLDGYETLVQSFTLAQGRVRELTLRLDKQANHSDNEPEAQAEMSPELASSATESGGVDRGASQFPVRTVALISGAALAAAGLGLGIGFTLDAQNASDDADELKRQAVSVVGAGGCRSNPDARACTELSDAIDREHRSQRIALVGFVGGGALAVATLAGYFLWPSPEADQAAFHVLPAVGPGQIGVLASGKLSLGW